MKIRIEKSPHGGVKIELTHETAKKPIVVTLTHEQARAVVGMLDTAVRATAFSFEYEAV
jgi:hypothetical protein